MNAIYPEETKKLDIISHLEELRKRILYCLAVLLVLAILAFWQGDFLMRFVKRPINGLVAELIFIGPTEAFIAYIKVALLAGFIVSFPFIVYHAWAFLSPAFEKKTRKRIVLWMLLSLVLFFTGVCFSYFLAIPLALDFLMGFSSGIAVPKITLGNYISFFGALILCGGIIFEIPVVIGLLADIGLLRTEVLRKKRHYAVIAVLIFAAIITPTQDILNMLLFALPMIFLYEIGIIIASVIEKHKK